MKGNLRCAMSGEILPEIMQGIYKAGDEVPKHIAMVDQKAAKNGVKLFFDLDCEFISGALRHDFKPRILIGGKIYNNSKHGKLMKIMRNGVDHIDEITIGYFGLEKKDAK